MKPIDIQDLRNRKLERAIHDGMSNVFRTMRLYLELKIELCFATYALTSENLKFIQKYDNDEQLVQVLSLDCLDKVQKRYSEINGVFMTEDYVKKLDIMCNEIIFDQLKNLKDVDFSKWE